MTIQEFLDSLDSMPDNVRADTIPKLMKMLCPLSENQMLNFQHGWNTNLPFDEFKKAQNVQLKNCVEMELTQIGADTRVRFGLPRLLPKTQIK